MKKLYLLWIFISVVSFAKDSSELNSFKSDSYIGMITELVNFREGPGTEYSIITSLEANKQVFIISNIPVNNYYNIIDIESNIEGYVYKSFIEFVEKVDKSKGEMFASTGKTNKYDTQIEIFNNTDKNLTLKLNNKSYEFKPKEKTTISAKPGLINFIASAPNVIPLSGSKNFEEYSSFSWEFYIRQVDDINTKIPDFIPPVTRTPILDPSRNLITNIKIPDFKKPNIPPLRTNAKLKSPNYNNSFKNIKIPQVKRTDVPNINNLNTNNSFYKNGLEKNKSGDYTGAILDFDKAIEIDPNFAKAYHNRGISKRNLKDNYGAISDYNKAIEIDPNYTNAYHNRGISKKNLNDYYGAISDYNKALEIDPVYVNVYINRGISKKNLKDYRGAISDYNKAIELDPNTIESYYNKALVYVELDDHYGAISNYNKVIELNPNYEFKVYYNRAVSKSSIKDYNGALVDYNKAIERYPNFKSSFRGRGILKEKLGDLNGACMDWKKASELGDNDASRWVEKQCM